MTAKVLLTARPQSFKFSDRSLNLEVPVKVGRAYKGDKADPGNCYFDCKVLSKAHALFLYEDSKFFLLDTGSSNGTFVNNIRLSKAGMESELTEVFTGDIVRFGSDVLDKARNVTQKSVVLKLQLIQPDGEEQSKRSSQSRLFHPSDSYEDVALVTGDLQKSLTRERMLEEKLLTMKNIITKNSDEIDFKTFLDKLQEEMLNIYEEIQPSKIIHDNRKIERLMKENKELVMKCKEFGIRLESKEKSCVGLEERSVKDEQHIANLGFIIDKLKMDISNLQNVIDTVKNTQEKVRDEYETTLMKQRKMFDDSTAELTHGHKQRTESITKKSKEERFKLESQVAQLKEKLESPANICWSSCSSQASMSDSPTPSPSMRSASQATQLSSYSMDSARTVLYAINKAVNYKEEDQIDGISDFDIGEDLDKSWELFNGMLKAKDDEMNQLKLDIKDILIETELIQLKENQNVELRKLVDDLSETIHKLETENVELNEVLKRNANKIAHEQNTIRTLEENAKNERDLLKLKAENISKKLNEKHTELKETQVLLAEAKDDILSLEEANGRLKGQAISKWVDAAESDFDCLFQEEFNQLRSESREQSRRSSERPPVIQEVEMEPDLADTLDEIKTPSVLDDAMQTRVKVVFTFLLMVFIVLAAVCCLRMY